MRSIVRYCADIAIVLAVAASPGFAQPFDRADRLHRHILDGKGDSVRPAIADMLARQPDNPESIFLTALLQTDAEQAVKSYQRIVNDFPDSHFADDALYRLYQYSISIGAASTAERFLYQLQRKYPDSPFATRNLAQSRNGLPSAKSGAGIYTVQAGSFASASAARERSARLRELGYSAEVTTTSAGGTLIAAVLVGDFPNHASADVFARKLRERHNIHAVVLRRDTSMASGMQREGKP